MPSARVANQVQLPFSAGAPELRLAHPVVMIYKLQTPTPAPWKVGLPKCYQNFSHLYPWD